MTLTNLVTANDARPLRLLVLEDDDDFQELLRVLLRRLDLHVPLESLFLSRVADARRVVQAAHVDVVLSDFHLPDGTGLDLLQKVREVTPRAHRIVLTGHPDAARDHARFDDHVDRLWDKRKGPKELLALLQGLFAEVSAS